MDRDEQKWEQNRDELKFKFGATTSCVALRTQTFNPNEPRERVILFRLYKRSLTVQFEICIDTISGEVQFIRYRMRKKEKI